MKDMCTVCFHGLNSVDSNILVEITHIKVCQNNSGAYCLRLAIPKQLPLSPLATLISQVNQAFMES